jgi:hypothetical protein
MVQKEQEVWGSGKRLRSPFKNAVEASIVEISNKCRVRRREDQGITEGVPLKGSDAKCHDR